MEQIAVTKIIKESNGSETHRNMTLPKNIWETIVKNGSEIGVSWKLRQPIKIDTKPLEMIQKQIKSEKVVEGETDIDSEVEEAKEEKVDVVDAPELSEKPKKRKYTKRS